VQHKNGPADVGRLREIVGGLDLGDVQVQGFGTPDDALIRIELQPGGDAAQQVAVEKVRAALVADDYDVRRTESIGGTVSGELAFAGFVGLSLAMLAILAYIWFRFEWQFAIGAVVSTMHDVVITIGLFAVTGIEFNQSSIAAILTIIGYSLNDTVVVYDRVREFMRKFRKLPLIDLLDQSINSTLSRTVLTGPAVFLALLALVVFGGEVIRSFTLSMLFGVLVGTYSSIFIAAPILMYLGLKTKPEQDKADSVDAKRAGGAAV
jgi:SecD/SecF fusion protein